MCKKEKATKLMCDEEAKDWSKKKPELEIKGERTPLVKYREKLRFKIGTAVECFIAEDVWANGVIVDTHYREPYWPASQPSAPYQIELANDQLDVFRAAGMPPEYATERKLIFSVWDDDHQIRKLPETTKLSPGIAKIQMDIVD